MYAATAPPAAQSICDMGATILEGYLPGDRYPITGPRGQYGAMCMIGTFSQYGVIDQTSAVRVDDDLPLDKAMLVGCEVPTGWGSAVNTANITRGNTVAVYGIGGIGINADPGHPLHQREEHHRHRPAGEQAPEGDGTRRDPRVRHRRRGPAAIAEVTRGQQAPGRPSSPSTSLTAEVVKDRFNAIGKGGTVVVTGLEQAGDTDRCPLSS